MLKIEMFDGDSKTKKITELEGEAAEALKDALMKISKLMDEEEDEDEKITAEQREAEFEKIRDTYMNFVEMAAEFAYKYDENPKEVYNSIAYSGDTMRRLIERALG